ncbi:nucleotide pyrophosphatase family protein [Acetobacter indonesiensis NRIC 0313]|uniref:Alkaline phosphatase family protein n=1 Tax=Acetobacter indonesiensis TaxID=104101 RepID=A0A6N3T259_9PROT|nr:ectonucleotide pyrophosphatase/phosphodiesterase [Acetobacter indonesiensis]GAN62170.1 type I phosphodiesterase/nucleotide pyrophosphatase [Acetobacter indonesiensis]GBQ60683.1 nucleotide pyrophosphatase family protein [Acetobacter indonesiensis NRIC 0313]GEN02138.1 alkaline phosphatase family protein [Acetobacter indonesiensis]
MVSSGFLKILFLGSVLSTLSACAQQPQIRTAPPHVLMISLDGMKPDYVLHAQQHRLSMPVLTQFLTQGTYAEGVQGVLPTVTYPSHTTMITGVWPAQHGIYANTIFAPEGTHPGEWYWYYQAIQVPTLLQAAKEHHLTTASVSWPVTVGAPVDYLIAEFAQSEQTGLPKGATVNPPDLKQSLQIKPFHTASADEKKTVWSIGIIKQYNPQFMLVHLTDLDHQEHMHAPFSAEANQAAETLDGQVGRLIDAELQASPDAQIVVVSDHGFVRIDHKVALNLVLAKAGLLTLSSDNGKPRITAWDAQAWESGGSSAIILRNPQDQALVARVSQVLKDLAADPHYGIDRILTHDDVVRRGGNPAASFVIDFKIGYAASGSLKGNSVKTIPTAGTHGYLPNNPELYSLLLMKGQNIPAGRNLGVIDMRQIAPTVAHLLGVTLKDASLKSVL